MPLYKILYTLVVAPLWWQKSSNFLKLFLCSYKKLFYICNRNRVNERAISSVGSEHLPYKQGVTGSNPVSPTTFQTSKRESFFIKILIGRLAQLVQSTCLTSRGSLVRIQYRPPKQNKLFNFLKSLFVFRP